MKKKDMLLHLIGEMSSYILSGTPRKMVISLHQEEDGVHLCILDENDHTEREIEDIRKALNSQKRPELAGYYGAMTGHDLLGGARLDLMGWQIKHADVTSIGSGIKIDLWMGGDAFQSDAFTIPVKD